MEIDLLGILRDGDRLRALAETELMDSPQEERFDRYTALAATILNTPAALVSLVDDHRQFFKSAVGLSEPWASRRQTPLSHSFCKHAVAAGEPLIIDDATKHPLVRDNLAVQELGVQAYAGVPLESAGQTLGVFCVIDNQPRTWTTAELATMRALAAAVTTEIELSRARRELREKEALISAITSSAQDVIITLTGDGQIVFANRAIESMFGHSQESAHGMAVARLLAPREREAQRKWLEHAERSGELIGERTFPMHGLRRSGEEFPVELSVSRWHRTSGNFYTAVVRDVTEREASARALRDKEEQLRLTVEGAPIGIATCALGGRWTSVNDAFCRIVGFTREQLLKLDWQTITHPDDVGADLQQVEKLLAGLIDSYSLDKRYLHRDGHSVWIQLSVALVRNEDGTPKFFIAQLEDMTQRRRLEAQASTFFEHSVDMLAITNEDTVFERVNSAWLSLGWSKEDLVGRRVYEFVHPADHQKTEEGAVALQQAGSVQRFRHRFLAKDGSIRWLEWNAQRTEGGSFFAVARDMTKQMEMEEALRQSSLMDELTGLRNRRGFMLLGEQQLSNAARYRRSMVVLFADLNGLKQVNDRLGHDEGDRALVAMADVLRGSFRRADIIARLGGDEFVVLAEGDREFARNVEDKVQKNVAAANAQRRDPWALSASLGVVLYEPGETRSLSQLLQSADKLMYDAKRRMRGGAP